MDGLQDFLKPISKNENCIAKLRMQYQSDPLLIYAISEIAKEIKQDQDIDFLSPEQLQYIYYIDNGMTDQEYEPPKRSLVVIWHRTNLLFAKCIDIIKEAQAEEAESVLWKGATDKESKDNISRMFALKARKPEYRENAVLPGANIITVRVTIDGQPIDISQSLKDITDEKQE